MSDPGDLVLRLSRRIRPLLAGHEPQIQGIVLADLVSLFIAGHHPALREEMLALHVDTVRQLIPASEKEIFTDGKPEGWDKQ
jgi:hypothetical protein